MLARFAENSFWLARYIERAENLARILDVQEIFERKINDHKNWEMTIQLQSDEDAFFKKHTQASKANVLHFYILDKESPSSIVSSIAKSRENARSLRHLISTEMWTQLNVFYKELCKLNQASLSENNVCKTLAYIKEQCQLHAGITSGTVYRDEVYIFYQLGKFIERADMTSRLLDIKYYHLLPSLNDVGSIIDVNQWNILLRHVSGYHAYRRAYTGKTTAQSVVGFLLFNPDFSRSFIYSLKNILDSLKKLKEFHEEKKPPQALAFTDKIIKKIEKTNANEIILSGLHEFLDGLQKDLINLSNYIYNSYLLF